MAGGLVGDKVKFQLVSLRRFVTRYYIVILDVRKVFVRRLLLLGNAILFVENVILWRYFKARICEQVKLILYMLFYIVTYKTLWTIIQKREINTTGVKSF